jgi:hypothetical protein
MKIPIPIGLKIKMTIQKSPEIKILQITASSPDMNADQCLIYGLGHDNKIYWWDNRSGQWLFDIQESKIIPNQHRYGE